MAAKSIKKKASKSKSTAKGASKRKSTTKKGSSSKRQKTAKKSGKRKSAEKKSSSKADAAQGGRAKSAYQIFCTVQREEIMKKEGLSGDFSEMAKAVARAWKDLPGAERQRFDAVADVERSRVSLLALLPKAKFEEDASRLVRAVKESLTALLTALTKAGPLLRQLPVGVQAVCALETLERKLGPATRRELGRVMAKIASSPAAASALQKVLGPVLADRVMEVLRRIRDGTSATPRKSSNREAIERALTTPPKPTTHVDEETRTRVTGLLLKTFSRRLGRAEVLRCKKVEQAIFTLCADDSKKYKGRSRSLLFNLSAADNSLLDRFMADEVSAEDLAQMGHEDLAPDSLKRERQELREKTMTEVLAAAPSKRQRHLENTDSKIAERITAEEERSEEEPVDEAPAEDLVADHYDMWELPKQEETFNDGLGSSSSSSSSSGSESGSGSDSGESSESESSSES